MRPEWKEVRCLLGNPETFVGDGLAIENVETERNYPEMVVWRLGFDATR